MGKSEIKYVLIGLIALMLAGVGVYAIQQKALISRIKVLFGRAKLISLSWDKIAIDIFLKVINVSDIDVNIEGYQLTAYINDRRITSFMSNQPGYIQANGESEIALNIITNPIEALGNIFKKDVLSAIFLDYSKVIIRIKGVISVNHRGLDIKDIPIDLKENLKNLMIMSSAQNT